MRSNHMRTAPWPAVMLALLGAAVGACGDGDPLKPNRNPVIQSLTAFPAAIGPGDSTVVTCEATDPDGNPLVYDWLTDGRLVIKDNPPGDSEVYNSPYNWQVFYHGPASPFDSAWVECTARDNKGGAAVRLIKFAINQ